jgi:hypothetical protein
MGNKEREISSKQNADELQSLKFEIKQFLYQLIDKIRKILTI